MSQAAGSLDEAELTAMLAERFAAWTGDEPEAADAWRERASCRGMSQDIFFVERGDRPDAAMAVCKTCGVWDECLFDAVRRNEKLGVWGATAPRTRRRLRSHLRAAGVDLLQPPDDPDESWEIDACDSPTVAGAVAADATPSSESPASEAQALSQVVDPWVHVTVSTRWTLVVELAADERVAPAPTGMDVVEHARPDGRRRVYARTRQSDAA